MLGKEKRNREVQQDVAGKMNLSKDDIFKKFDYRICIIPEGSNCPLAPEKDHRCGIYGICR